MNNFKKYYIHAIALKSKGMTQPAVFQEATEKHPLAPTIKPS